MAERLAASSEGTDSPRAGNASIGQLLAGMRPWQLVLLVVATCTLFGSMIIAAALAFTGQFRKDDLRETMPPIPAAFTIPKELLKPMPQATVAEIEAAIESNARQAAVTLSARVDEVIGSVQTINPTSIACVFTAAARPGLALNGTGTTAMQACSRAAQGPAAPAQTTPTARPAAPGGPK